VAAVSPALRRIILPVLVLASPPVFLLYREAATCGTPTGCSPVGLAGTLLLALLAPGGAWLVVRGVVDGRVPAWLAPRSDDWTLTVLGIVLVGTAGYLVAGAAGAIPAWLDDLLGPLGLLLGLPLAVVHTVMIGVGRALGQPPMGVRLLVAAVGVGLTGGWWYLLSSTVARGLSRANEPRD
jgi:hypothetical protein